VFTFFHLLKEGAYLRDVLKVQTPVSDACTDLLLPLAEWFLHSWVIYMILCSTSHILLNVTYILCTFFLLHKNC